MPVIRAADAVRYETHGSEFRAFVSPSMGSAALCAWQLQVPPNLSGVRHQPTREEVLLIPANSHLRVDSGPAGASAWVTTTPGLEALTEDGTRIAPPWAA